MSARAQGARARIRDSQPRTASTESLPACYRGAAVRDATCSRPLALSAEACLQASTACALSRPSGSRTSSLLPTAGLGGAESTRCRGKNLGSWRRLSAMTEPRPARTAFIASRHSCALPPAPRCANAHRSRWAFAVPLRGTRRAYLAAIRATAMSSMRLEKPHSLSYQDSTLTIVPCMTRVWVAS